MPIDSSISLPNDGEMVSMNENVKFDDVKFESKELEVHSIPGTVESAPVSNAVLKDQKPRPGPQSC